METAREQRVSTTENEILTPVFRKPHLLRPAAPLLALLLLLPSLLGGTCSSGGGEAYSPSTSLSVRATLNGIADEYNDLLVVPSRGFLINASFDAQGTTADPSLFKVVLELWGSNFLIVLPIDASRVDEASAVVEVASSLPDGSYTAYVLIGDSDGGTASTQLDFAVRGFLAAPPISQGQFIWLDFESDRDDIPGPDFAQDLIAFGLASPADPTLAAAVEADVTSRVLSRVESAYYDYDANLSGDLDPVEIQFRTTAPAEADVTQICIGGAAPENPLVLGSILIDPRNSNRRSVECGTIPPTGIFPMGLSYFAFQASYQAALDPVTPGLGIPIGEHPLDEAVLSPGFDPAAASTPEQQRFADVDAAMQAFADALGTIVAHEVGHALGLVPPGFPGGGLYGGFSGGSYSHNINASGSLPAEIDLMNIGSDFSFAVLAGIEGNPLPSFRPTNYAYLRDRLSLSTGVTSLLPPPSASLVTPNVIASAATAVSVMGSSFVGPPRVALRNENYIYQSPSESWISDGEIHAWILQSSLPSGVYDLELTNPDGQLTILPSAITVP